MIEEPKFKVGDKVGVFSERRLILWDEVAKVTPTGRLRLKQDSRPTYNPDGWERTNEWDYNRIKHDTPELRQEMADEQEEKELRRLPNSYPWRELSVPQLRELKVLLDRFVEKNKP